MHPNLTFEQAPPISVPFRFFLTAPWFGVLAGVLLAHQGGDMLATRWMPSALAGTHLLVAGFMLQAMCGALLQFVPVACGGNVWRPRLIASVVHPGLMAGVLLLATAFLTQQPGLFIAAALVFGMAGALFVLVVGLALWQTPAQGATVAALRLAQIGLLVTVALGISLATALARGLDWPLPMLTDVHAAWGLGGWGFMLLAGVAYFVVPMFQLTPPYPLRLARSLPFLMFGVLLLWSLQGFGMNANTRMGLLFAGLGIAGIFAAQTLDLQHRRRRKVPDTTLLFFRVAMLCLLLLLAAALLLSAISGLAADPRTTPWMGTLVIVGVFVSVINGMLYKIVPFLGWLHLQRLGGLHQPPPPMNQLIPEVAMRYQFRAHLAALMLLQAAVWITPLARPAGLLLAVSCGWLGINLARATRSYAGFKDRIPATA